jgi:hypothetical protein
LIDRKLPKIKIQNTPFSKRFIDETTKKVVNTLDISRTHLNYYMHIGTISNQAYNKDKYPINIKLKDDSISDIISCSDHLNLEALTKPVVKHFIYYPK